MNQAQAESALLDDICERVHDPLGFVKYIFPWGKGELSEPGPRKWQGGILESIGQHLQNPKTKHQPLQIAVSSGKGIGKSALVGMVIEWGMSTCEDCKIVLTANTDPQLRTKTWPEVSKWFRMALNSHWFRVEAESITIQDPRHKRTWRTDRMNWSEHNTEAFAGLHNKGKRIIVIFDEASAIHDKIWEVTEGALTDEGTEIIWLAFGNPTRTDGRFRECFGRLKHRWQTYQIDSRDVEGTNKEQFQREIEDYGGEEQDHVKVWIRGMFPSASSTQFISAELVEACKHYKAMGYQDLPKVLSIDVARFGDDKTVIGTRQGRKGRILKKYHGLDTVQVAERAIEWIDKEEPDAVVVDGDGLGAGVVDQLRARGYGRHLFEFHGMAKANDAEQYFNRRAECWGLMREWIRSGAELPDDAECRTELSGPEYLLSRKGQIQLERKQDMKSRGFSSPDSADMLAMSFSVQIGLARPKPKPHYVYEHSQQEQNWMM